MEKSYGEARTVMEGLTKGHNDEMRQYVPLLIRQETQAVKTVLNTLVRVVGDEKYPEDQANASSHFLSVLRGVLRYYLSMSSKTQQETWDAMLINVFEDVLHFSEAQFSLAASAIYNDLCDVLAVGTSKDLRFVLCQIFKRIGVMYAIPK